MKNYLLFLCFVGVWRDIKATEPWQVNLRKLYMGLWVWHWALLVCTAYGIYLCYTFLKPRRDAAVRWSAWLGVNNRKTKCINTLN